MRNYAWRMFSDYIYIRTQRPSQREHPHNYRRLLIVYFELRIYAY